MRNYRIEEETPKMKSCDMEFFPFFVKPCHMGTTSHIHESIELLFVTEGDFSMSCDDRTVHAQAGDVLLFRSNSIHKTMAGNGEKNAYWVLKISPRLIVNFLPKNKASDSLIRLSVNHESARMIWRAEELSGSEIAEGFSKLIRAFEAPDADSELAMRIAAATVVLGILRGERTGAAISENTAVSELIYKAIVYINDNYADDISAESVSERLGISYSYFSRTFKRIAGKTFRQYLNSTRINHGEQLLLNTEKSVTEIATLCGFGNVSHFIATYRDLKGVTPLAARNG